MTGVMRVPRWHLYIYTNSYITLAAAKSSNPIASLLGMNCYQKIAEIPNQQGPPSKSFAGIDTELRASSLPLFERAWVFQERVLSPRVVYFCAEREYWECKSGNSFGGEMLRIFGSSKEEMIRDTRITPSGMATNPAILHRRYDPDRAKISQRRRVVTRYSRLQLFREEDIFPALQGITHGLGEHRNRRYYAGLWEDTLFYDLLWRPGPSAYPAMLRGGKLRAPSWSWASFIGPIIWYSSADHTLRPFVSVKAISSSPVGEDEMGQVKAGQMVLEGRCAVLEQSTLSTLGELGEADWKTSDYTPDYGNDTLMKLVEAEPRDIYTLSAELGKCGC
jgi:hypothetical protein